MQNIGTRIHKFDKLSPDTTNRTILLILISLFLLGPNFKIYSAYLQDLLFFFFLILYIFRKGNRFFEYSGRDIIFLAPFSVMFLSDFGKLLIGYDLESGDLLRLVTMVKLFCIAKVTFSFFPPSTKSEVFDEYSRRISKYLAISIIVTSLLGIGQFFNISIVNNIIERAYEVKDIPVSNIEAFETDNRVTSIFHGSNAFGSFSATAVFLLFFFYQAHKNFLSIAAIPLGVFALLLAGSRASVAMLVLSIFLYYCSGINFKRFAKGVVMVVLLGVALLIFVHYMGVLIGSENVYRFEEISNFFLHGQLPGSMQARLDTLSWMPKSILNNPHMVFGVSHSYASSSQFTSPDNQYVAWLLRYGIVGVSFMILWVLGVFIYLVSLRKKMKKSSEPVLFVLSKGILIFWFWMIVHGISEDTFFGSRRRELLFFLMAFIISWIHREKPQDNKGTGSSFCHIAAKQRTVCC